jgi:hypothetical protein
MTLQDFLDAMMKIIFFTSDIFIWLWNFMTSNYMLMAVLAICIVHKILDLFGLLKG